MAGGGADRRVRKVPWKGGAPVWSPLHVALLLGVFSVLIWPAVVVWLIVYAVSSLRRHGRDLARIAARLERIEQRIGAP